GTGGDVAVDGGRRRAEGRAPRGDARGDRVRREGDGHVGRRLGGRLAAARVHRAGEERLGGGASGRLQVLDRVEVGRVGEREAPGWTVAHDVAEPGEHLVEDAGVGDPDGARERREGVAGEGEVVEV